MLVRVLFNIPCACSGDGVSPRLLYYWSVHLLVHALPFGYSLRERQVLPSDGGDRRCDASPPRCHRQGGASAESGGLGSGPVLIRLSGVASRCYT